MVYRPHEDGRVLLKCVAVYIYIYIYIYRGCIVVYVGCAYVGLVNEQLVTTYGMNNVIIGGNSSDQILILLNIMLQCG